jgi:hypothetical protein
MMTPALPVEQLPIPLLQPMEVAELLDEAFDLYKRNFRVLFLVTVLLNIPVAVSVLATPEESAGRSVANLFSAFAWVVTLGALTHAAAERRFGRPVTVGAAYRQGLRQSLRMISAYLICFLAAAGGFLLFIFPGVIISLWTLLVAPVVMVENRGGIRALQRCRQLASGTLWRLFLMALAFWIVSTVFAIVLLTLAGLIVGLTGMQGEGPVDLSDPRVRLVQAAIILLLGLFQVAWTPVFTNAQLLAYYDFRIRQEAYDLELVVQAAEERARARAESSPQPESAGEPAARSSLD